MEKKFNDKEGENLENKSNEFWRDDENTFEGVVDYSRSQIETRLIDECFLLESNSDIDETEISNKTSSERWDEITKNNSILQSFNSRVELSDSEKIFEKPKDITSRLMPKVVNFTSLDEIDNSLLNMIPDEVYESMPIEIKEACYLFDGARKDVFFLSLITTIGGSLSNTFMSYKGDRVYSNLYLAIFAPAASGKSAMKWVRKIFNPIDFKIRNNSAEDDSDIRKTLFIAADITGAMWAKQLADNDSNMGIMFATEAETLTKSCKSNDLGGFVDGLRTCAEGETYEVQRKSTKEHYIIENPKLTLVISGTPNQIFSLIPSVEDGLASRFLYYHFKGNLNWEKVSGYADRDFETLLKPLMRFVENMHSGSKINGSMEVLFKEPQLKRFDELFESWSIQNRNKYGEEAMSLIFRLAPRILKLATIFASISLYKSEQSFSSKIICSDRDFEIAMLTCKVLLNKSMGFLGLMKKKRVVAKYYGQKYDLLCHIEDEFTTKEIFDIAKQIGVKVRTAEGYVKGFLDDGLILRVKKGCYRKLF